MPADTANRCGHYAGDHCARAESLGARSIGCGFCRTVHDVGKLFIDERILNKSGAADGRGVCQSSRRIRSWGWMCCGRFQTVERVAQAVLSHHEAFDGSGYPFGLRGESIPLSGGFWRWWTRMRI